MKYSKALTCPSLTQLPIVAQQIIDFAQDIPVWLFYGDMGVGKTTLIKALGEVWRIEDTISSPTFALVNEYRNTNNQVFYHFDFYRIEDEEEAIDIGIDEYFSSSDYCWVEWPTKIRNLLPETYIRIEIRVNDDLSRTIYLSRHEHAGEV